MQHVVHACIDNKCHREMIVVSAVIMQCFESNGKVSVRSNTSTQNSSAAQSRSKRLAVELATMAKWLLVAAVLTTLNVALANHDERHDRTTFEPNLERELMAKINDFKLRYHRSLEKARMMRGRKSNYKLAFDDQGN